MGNKTSKPPAGTAAALTDAVPTAAAPAAPTAAAGVAKGLAPENDDCCTCSNGETILTMTNIICLFAGLSMMVLGFFAYWRPQYLFTVMGTVQGVSEIPVTFDLGGIFKASAVFLIVVGTFIATAGMFGTCGDKETKRNLVLGYVVTLSILIVIKLVVIIFIAAFPGKLKEISQNVMNMSLIQFQKDIRFQEGTMILPNNAFSLGWTVLQLEANCCGAYNYTDYSGWLRNITINGVIRSAAVPISCCKKNESLSLVSTPSFNASIFTNLDGCLAGDYAYMNQKNCYDSAMNNIHKNRRTYMGIVAAVIAQETLMIILLAVLYCKNKKDEEKKNKKKKPEKEEKETEKKEREKKDANITQQALLPPANIHINFVLDPAACLKMPGQIEAAYKEQVTRIDDDGY